MRRLLYYVFIGISGLCSCKTTQGQRMTSHGAAMSATPMSCLAEGRVLSIVPPGDADTCSLCFRYPCRAMVLITSVSACGSAVSFSLKTGDTIEVKFAYTLLNTGNVLPEMKAHYPGLKKGARFTANIEYRMKAGNAGTYVIYDYRRE